MEDTFKFYVANIPFLIFPEIKSLLVFTTKAFASKNSKGTFLKDQILNLQSPGRRSFLPQHFKVQFDKLVRADLDPEFFYLLATIFFFAKKFPI